MKNIVQSPDWRERRWGPERPRTGGWSLLAVMSDWQRGVDWLLVEYCRCRLRLDLRWCRWRASAEGLCLVGPPRSWETSRLGSSGASEERGQVRAAWWQEKKEKVVDRSRCRVAAHDWVCTRGLRRFTTKPLGYLVEPQNQDRRLSGRKRDPGVRRSFDVGGHMADRRACVGRTQTAAKVWSCDEEECNMTYLPMRGFYLNLSARGSLVICPT
jgi:hypothetical protein